MKILIFCTANLDLGSGSEIRARLIVEGLNYWGAKIHVIASGIPNEFIKRGIGFSALDLSRSWGEQISEAATKFQPNIYYCITEAGMDLMGRMAHVSGCPVVFDLHGLGFVEIVELGHGYGSRIVRIFNSLKWLSYIFKADAITVANPTLMPLLRKFNKNSYPVFGMTDVSRFTPNGNSLAVGHDKEKIQVLYAGNYFKWQGVDLLLRSILALLDEDNIFEFTIIGSVGSKKRNIREWKRKLSGRPVHFIEYVEYERISDYYRGADVLVIPRPFMISTYLAFPQKLLDYMASGRTVVATNIAPHRFALEYPPSGILCPPSVNGLVGALRQTRNDGIRRILSENAREKAVADYCHIRQTKRIYSLFDKLLMGN